MEGVGVSQRRGIGALRRFYPLRRKGAAIDRPQRPTLKFTWSMSPPTVMPFVEAIIWSTSTLRLRNAGPSTVYDPMSLRNGATCFTRRNKGRGPICEHRTLVKPRRAEKEKTQALSLLRV